MRTEEAEKQADLYEETGVIFNEQEKKEFIENWGKLKEGQRNDR
jgi:hypothetical protein